MTCRCETRADFILCPTFFPQQEVPLPFQIEVSISLSLKIDWSDRGHCCRSSKWGARELVHTYYCGQAG